MTNKEVIDKLVAYFKEHADFDTMARALANQMIDMKRMVNYSRLPLDEAENLCFRMEANAHMLDDFAQNGSKIKFWLINIQSGEK